MAMLELFTSESVTGGHPDKVADQISDAVLDEVLRLDPTPAAARVACETVVTTGLVLVTGEITTSAYVDIASIARNTIVDIGYDDWSTGFDGRTCGVLVAIDEQSPDIAGGVDSSYESRGMTSVEDALDSLGAGDQGMMVGFACTETDALMPLPIQLAHRISERLATVRRDGTVPSLRPDGKSQVTVRYDGITPVEVTRVVISTQHAPEMDAESLRQLLIDHVVRPSMPGHIAWDPGTVIVNPSGQFVLGGPRADAGLTGRKIIVDTYGGMARHGGGAFSGKDPTKVDRSAAYAARWVAKNIVAAGLADRVELQVAYAIGMAQPVSFGLTTFGTESVDPDKIVNAVREVFDLRPAAIIRDLGLHRPIFRPTAAYGHFGRDEFPWERTDRAEALRAYCG
ncbi:MAG: methionine adenosyltransferase [Actinomycetota bacterium]